MSKNIVNASDIGKAAYCPHSLSLAKRRVKESGFSLQLQKEGTLKHDKLTQTVLTQNEDSAQDSRCYVASYAFGSNHPITQDLRDWRDEILLSWSTGKLLVVIYYSLSPVWVRVCRHWPLCAELSKSVVIALHHKIRKGKK